MSHRRGFTLVEMLVAMAIGSVLVATAVAGLRVALQSMSATTRLSNENALLRAAWHSAHEEIDRWTAWDDPDDPARQGLRISGPSFLHPAPRVLGLPFTPFSGASSSVPASGGVPRTRQGIAPRAGAALDDATWEDDRGFDPSYAWAPHDPRGWWRGNLVERGHFFDARVRPMLGWWGRYALFTNTEAQPELAKWPVTLPDGTQLEVGYRSPDPVAHHWYANQLDAFSAALGYYGIVDYLPTNTLYGAYTSYTGSGHESYDGSEMLYAFRYFQGPNNFLAVVDMGKEADLCESAFRATLPSCAIIEQPVWSGTRQPTNDELLRDHYQLFDTDFTVSNGNYLGAHAGSGQGGDSYVRFRERALRPHAVLALEPAAWPHVEYAVGRFIKDDRAIAICRIRWTSALSGELSELSFAGLGTSLRGARQQRRPDRGWASWDDAAGAVCDPTLDSP